jgi:hypothetical protein
MGGGLKKAFEAVNGAGAKTIGAIGKVITSIRTFGTTATLIIGVGEAIKMVRTAWLAFSAVVVAIQLAQPLRYRCRGGWSDCRHVFSEDKTAETVAEIRKIPEAMMRGVLR